VKNSPMEDGEGDLIRGTGGCTVREYGLKFANLLFSFGSRIIPDYGKPEYITYMRNQLTATY